MAMLGCYLFIAFFLSKSSSYTIDQSIVRASSWKSRPKFTLNDPIVTKDGLHQRTVNETGFVRVELDMILSTDRYSRLRPVEESAANNDYPAIVESFVPQVPVVKNAVPRNFARDLLLRWPNGIIPYEFADDANFDENDMTEFNSALADFHNFTCLKLRKRNPRLDSSYLYIISGDGCYSHVGRVLKKQELSLAPGCRRKGIMQHELMHAIGFYHEQSRPDRDSYIDILQANVIPWLLHNFDKNPPDQVDSFNSKYDYLSIMHYGQSAFSARGEITIRTLDPVYQGAIGQRQILSFEDVRQVNRAYRCFRGCPQKEQDCGEGFLGKDCLCWCPPPRMPGFALTVMPSVPAVRCDFLPGGLRPMPPTTSMSPKPTKSWFVPSKRSPKMPQTVATKRTTEPTTTTLTPKTTSSTTVTVTTPETTSTTRTTTTSATTTTSTTMTTASTTQQLPVNIMKIDNSLDVSDALGSEPILIDLKHEIGSTTNEIAATVTNGVGEHTLEPIMNSKSPTCSDFVAKCTDWALNGDCFKMERFMTNYCPDACGLCGPTTTKAPEKACADAEPRCEVWKRFGLCKIASYNEWMAQKCSKSCGICDANGTHKNIQHQVGDNGIMSGMRVNLIDDRNIDWPSLPSRSGMALDTVISPTTSTSTTPDNSNFPLGPIVNRGISNSKKIRRPSVFRRVSLRPVFQFDEGDAENDPAIVASDLSQIASSLLLNDSTNNLLMSANWLMLPHVKILRRHFDLDDQSSSDESNVQQKPIMRRLTGPPNLRPNPSSIKICSDTSPSCKTLAAHGLCPFLDKVLLTDNGIMSDQTRHRTALLRGFAALHCRKSCGQCI